MVAQLTYKTNLLSKNITTPPLICYYKLQVLIILETGFFCSNKTFLWHRLYYFSYSVNFLFPCTWYISVTFPSHCSSLYLTFIDLRISTFLYPPVFSDFQTFLLWPSKRLYITLYYVFLDLVSFSSFSSLVLTSWLHFSGFLRLFFVYLTVFLSANFTLYFYQIPKLLLKWVDNHHFGKFSPFPRP